METKKLKTASLMLGLIAGSSIYLASPVYAQSDTGFTKSLIQTLIEKLNLDQNSVDKVVKDYQSERQSQRLETVEQKLTKAVEEGKINADQKSLILAKIKEWQTQKADWYKLTNEEKREKMAQHREDMITWSEDNNIDLKDIVGVGMGQFGRGFKHGYKVGQAN